MEWRQSNLQGSGHISAVDVRALGKQNRHVSVMLCLPLYEQSTERHAYQVSGAYCNQTKPPCETPTPAIVTLCAACKNSVRNMTCGNGSVDGKYLYFLLDHVAPDPRGNACMIWRSVECVLERSYEADKQPCDSGNTTLHVQLKR